MTDNIPDWLVPSSITGRELDEAVQHLRAQHSPRAEGPWRYYLDLAPAGVRIRKKSNRPARPRPEGHSKRSAISEWSHRSRTNLIWRLSTLDYTPMSADGRLPMLLTLTYPGDWQAVAPNGQAAKRHLAMFRRRFEREFGPLYAVWVMEWQRSGAPHFHLLVSVQVASVARVREWVAQAWPDIVAHPDPDHRRKHENAGTQLKHSTHPLDPRVAAIYFAKHAAPGKGAKWYQKQPPQAWKDAGSIGRLWGYWRLEPLVRTVPLSPEDAKRAARKLRKADQRARGRQRVRVMRVNGQTGEVWYRWTHRKAKPRLASLSGFLAVPDPLGLLRRISLLPSEPASTVEPGRGNLDRLRTIQRCGGATLLGQVRDGIQRAAVRAVVLARLVRRCVRAARLGFHRR